jgi:predicted AlkP superfamily pyrophosphatase or phosphodiesterase
MNDCYRVAQLRACSLRLPRLEHGRRLRLAFAGLALGAGLLLGVKNTSAASVLMISVDGMKPEYVTQADAHGLKIPFLRSLLADGTYASGVVGVWPTNTYPSHTTLLTGVAPAEHGVYNNLEFDPRHKFAESWYWYTAQIKVPTLWHVAKQAHLVTASVGWPVSVGSPDIDFLIPEYWRIFHPTADLNPSDRFMIAALSKPAGLLEGMQSRLGPYLMGNDTGVAADEIKTRFALDILGSHRPRFMTIHLSALDEAEHEHGPFSAEANEVMEATDAMLARLIAASRANDPAAIAVVVSDHGFTPLTHRVNLLIPFIQAGLITVVHDAGSAPQVTAWTAQPWLASGMAAIMLRDPDDKTVQDKVRGLLQRLQADPDNGIAQVLDAEAIHQRGAFPDAAFLVVMRPGYYTGNAISGDLVAEMAGHGGHGFSPDEPDMHASLFLAGPGIARHRNLGQIDMRQIAPTVAGLLALHLPAAATELPVRQ